MVSSDKTPSDQLSAKMRRKIARLHKQMDAWEAEGGVQPPPVLNRRTGEMYEFAPRRALDGGWLLEMLSASGCTKEQVDAVIFVLEPLIGYRLKIDAKLVSVLSGFNDRPSEAERREKHAKFRRSRIHEVKPSVEPSDGND